MAVIKIGITAEYWLVGVLPRAKDVEVADGHGLQPEGRPKGVEVRFASHLAAA